MIQALIHRLLQRRHFWRYATFSEVAELYASRTMRLFALRMVAVFTSIYMYQEGYSLVFITFFFAAFFFYKTLFAWPAALIIAQIGPKHGTFASNILAAISMIFLPFVPEYGIFALLAWSLFQASSTCLYDLCYLVDFSKVKNIEHAGKEIAYMNILEKVATGIGPVIGGVIASLFGPQLVMIIASVLFVLAAIPLFKTGEPTRTHQKLDFRSFPLRTTWRSLVAETAVGIDGYATGTAWTLFMMVIIFAGDGHEIYAKVGILASVALVSALLASYTFGRLIDHRRGGELLKIAVILNALTHAFRPFVGSLPGAVASNIANEAATTGYSMAFTRGMFDTADITGHRVVYLFLMELVVNLGASLAALILGFMLLMFGDEPGLKSYFFVVAIAVLVIGMPRFALYRK